MHRSDYVSLCCRQTGAKGKLTTVTVASATVTVTGTQLPPSLPLSAVVTPFPGGIECEGAIFTVMVLVIVEDDVIVVVWSL